MAGFITHRICSIPAAETSAETSAYARPSRETSAAALPFASTQVIVAPVHQCEANDAMNFATLVRPRMGASAAHSTMGIQIQVNTEEDKSVTG